MKKLLLLVFVITFAFPTYSRKVKIDSFYYNLDSSSSTATITYESLDEDKNYPELRGGDIVIPAEVSYEGRKYAVTEVGDSAFHHCKLHGLEVANSVKTIGKYAFYLCNFWTVVLPPSVTEIKDGAFLGNVTVSQGAYPSTLEYPFVKSQSMIELGFPYEVICYPGNGSVWSDGIIYSRDYKHLYFASFTVTGDLKLPSSVESISSKAFYICNALTGIDLPDGLKEIESLAFRDCESLKEVTIPNSVVTIGAGAFQDCDSLETVVLPNTLDRIESNTFKYCSNLKNISLPSSVKSIGSGAFWSTEIEHLLLTPHITKIEKDVFRSCWALQSIEIPSTVTYIGEEAFDNCRNLKEVKLHPGVNFIGQGAFSACISLEDIEIPEAVQELNPYTFMGCTSLKSVKWNSSLKKIGWWAFRDCSSLEEAVLPESIVSIADDAFEKCSGLKRVVLPEGLTTINDGTFQGCSSLKEINFPVSLKYIGEKAFQDCRSLESLVLTENLKDIRSEAFKGCSSIELLTLNSQYINSIGSDAMPTSVKELIIGEGVNIIPDNLCRNAVELSEVTIPNSVNTIGSYAFLGCSGLKSVSFGSGLTTIYDSAFSRCSSLAELVFPNSVKSIWRWAFSGCSGLKTIVFGENLMELGKEVFSGCENIETVYCWMSTPANQRNSTDIFTSKTYKNARLYVPAGKIDWYSRVIPWQYFSHIEEFDMSGIEEVYGGQEESVTVYTLDGKPLLWRSPSEAVDNLPEGIYIINGKKVKICR